MKYIKKDCGSFNLHMIKTDKFKTINMSVIFRDKIQKEEITIRNFLSDILVYSNNKYKKRKQMKQKQQDLYSVGINSRTYRLGNYYNNEFNLNFLDEKYSEKGMFKQSIEFLSDIIFDPNVINKAFDQTSFEIIKENTKKQIESIKENTSKYSMIRLFENMGKNMPYSYHSFGYMDDLEKITQTSLYDYYVKFINKNMIDIFIIGNIDFNETENIIKEKFKFRTFKKKPIDTIIKHKKVRKTIKKIVEEEQVSQSKLAIGCKIGDISEFERNYVLTVYNIILGGGSSSKLFKDVREKNSLCYNVFSSPYKLDSILLIGAGIARKNTDKTIRLVKRNLKDIEKGLFDEEMIKKAQNKYISSVNSIEEHPHMLISSYYAMELLGTDEPEERKKQIMKVTYDDIRNLAKKISIDTIYLLGGEDNYE